MITAFNLYYAKPGQEQAVLRQRLYASDVRESMGVPRGTVVSRTSGSAELPHVMWEQDFDDVAAHERDMAARAASVEFERVRAGMRELLRRFERPLFEVCDTDGAPRESARFVSVHWVFCQPAAADPALEALGGIARHCASLGIEQGRRLRLVTRGNDLPALLWVQHCADDESLTRAATAIASAPSAPTLMALADRVVHSNWAVR